MDVKSLSPSISSLSLNTLSSKMEEKNPKTQCILHIFEVPHLTEIKEIHGPASQPTQRNLPRNYRMDNVLPSLEFYFYQLSL